MNARVEHSSFDPKKAVGFDLATGQVCLSDNERAVIVPAAALSAVIAAAGETAARELGRSLGRTVGGRVGNVREQKIEDVVSVLARELAVVGLGTLALERWGRALVVTVSDAGVDHDGFLAAVVEGMLAAASGRELRTHPLGREGSTLRVLVGNVAAIERVVGWLAEGTSFGDAIVRLHAPKGAS
jgi:hypothetical protein